MKSVSCHYYVVSDKVPPSLRAFVVAFMSYFLQFSYDRNKNQRLKSLDSLYWRLAIFLGYIEKEVKFYQFQPYLQDFPYLLIRDFLRKENGIIMTSNEQFELFSNILRQKDQIADVYLYQEGCKTPIEKVCEHEESTTVIPIIRLLDGRFAATSVYNCFSFDFNKRLLRTETQKQCREKRIAKNKLYFSKFLTIRDE